MDIIKVEITYPDGDKKIYEVISVFEHTDDSGEYLVMGRKSDGDLGYIPKEIIKSWRILEGA